MPTTANWQATSWWSRLLTVEQANKGYRCVRRVYIALYSAADPLLPRWLPASRPAAALLGATCFLGLLNVASAAAATAFAVLACLAAAALHATTADEPDAALLVSEGTVESINLGGSADFGEGLRRRRRSARSALVTYLGVAGDEQEKDLIKSWGGHGGARKAVMLFSADVIRRVNRDGHRDVAAGACGEQLTVEGVDWREMRTGARVAVGRALLEVTYLKAPCSTQATGDAPFDAAAACCRRHQLNPHDLARRLSFLGGAVRIHPEFHPDDCRVLARVLRQGRVSVGDRVAVYRHEGGRGRLVHCPDQGPWPTGLWRHEY